MTQPPQRPPRRRKKKEPLVILVLALLVALVAWPFEKLFGGTRDRDALAIATATALATDRDGARNRDRDGVRNSTRDGARSRAAGRARLVTLVAVAVVVVLLLAAGAVDAATGRGAIHSNVTVYGIERRRAHGRPGGAEARAGRAAGRWRQADLGRPRLEPERGRACTRT